MRIRTPTNCLTGSRSRPRKVRSRIWSFPYTLDCNDMRFATPQGFNSGDQFFTYLKDSFDVLYREGEQAPKMMSVGLHCRLVGRPGRAAALERFLDYALGHERVWICRRVDIARTGPRPIPGKGDRHALRTGNHAAGAAARGLHRRSAAPDAPLPDAGAPAGRRIHPGAHALGRHARRARRDRQRRGPLRRLNPQAPAVLLGSHLDTVRNAGRYDGLFGILSAIACVRALHEAGRRLPSRWK